MSDTHTKLELKGADRPGEAGGFERVLTADALKERCAYRECECFGVVARSRLKSERRGKVPLV
jgi:hypothetical protein